MTSQRISGCHGNLPLAVLSEVGLAAGAAWLCFSSFGALSFHSSWAVWGAQREELPDGKGGGVSVHPFVSLGLYEGLRESEAIAGASGVQE